jgi:outer membrane receptor protein involved in Fe transport
VRRLQLSETDREARAAGGFRLTPLAALVAGTAWLACGALHAAEPPAASESSDKPAAPEAQALDAVTVRSRNRIERLQDVPLSVSVVPGVELERLTAYGIDAITKRAANVSWNLGNQRTSSLSIRGIGKVGQTEAQDPSVGIIVDGVSYAYNALTSSFDFVDIDTIEVSRGPQGTLLGKNTSVGNIIFNTRRPSFTPTADFSLGYRQGDGLLGTAALGGPVIDGLLAWRGTFSVNRGQGDIQNQYNRDITYTNQDRVSGRVQFLLTPGPEFNARVSLELQPRAGETTNGRSFSFANTHSYADGSAIPVSATSTESRLARRWFSDVKSYTINDYYNTINNDNQRALVTGSRGVAAELNWTLGGHTLTSITAYKDYHFNAVNDEGTPFDVYRNSGGYWNDYKQSSQEFRISSPVGGLVDYQGGLYFIKVENSATYNRAWGNDAGAWFASGSQYTTLDADGNGRYLLLSSLANLKMAINSTPGVQEIDNKSAAVFAQANWHLSEALTFTTGARVTREDRNNLGSSVIFDNGSAPELNPVQVNKVALGGFATTTTGDLGLNPDGSANSATQLALADYTARKYFNAASYGSLTATQKRQIAAAKAIRQAQIGVVFNPTWAEPYKATQPTVTLSPSYKFSPDVTGYFSFQHGEKAGIAQFYNGVSYPVKAEKTNNFELGVKSALLGKTLIVNADVFLSRISNYQQAVRVVDEYTTAQNVAAGITPAGAYASITGSVPRVKVYGIEVDGVYAGIANTTLRFSGAYNRSLYDSFPNAAQPAESAATSIPGRTVDPYRDISGQPLAGAPKLTFNIGGDYRLPVFGDKVVHTSANLAYTTGYYSDNSLSVYSWIPKNYSVDWALGIGKLNNSFDVSLVVKNLFDNDTPQSQTWTSVSPAVPRSIGILFSAKL